MLFIEAINSTLVSMATLAYIGKRFEDTRSREYTSAEGQSDGNVFGPLKMNRTEEQTFPNHKHFLNTQ